MWFKMKYLCLLTKNKLLEALRLDGVASVKYLRQ